MGKKFKGLLLAMLPSEVVREAAPRLKVQQRARVLDVVALVWALVLAGGTEECGRLASAMRSYIKQTGRSTLSRSAFYQWFDAELLTLMQELKEHCLDYVEAQPRHLPGILSGRLDWRAVDSTVVKVPNDLVGHYPGTGDYASLKVHKTYSLGTENVVKYHITPGRDHDGPELIIDESWRGMGLLVDLGYASFRLLRECQAHDVHVVIKLKANWNVRVNDTVGSAEMARWLGDSGVADSVSCDDFIVDPNKPLDIDVILGPSAKPIHLRLVGIPTAKGFLLFLTNLPRQTHSHDDVAMLYRLRWTIELDNKLGKSACRLDHVTAKTPVSAEILVHAAMMASMLANAFAHEDHLKRGFVGTKTPRLKEGPVHPMLVAKSIASSAHHLGSMLSFEDGTDAQWDRLASAIRALSLDPNWRRTPSPIDIVKRRVAPGWKPKKRPKPRKAKAPTKGPLDGLK